MALDYAVVGHRLKRARIKKNMTQEDLAEEIDVSVAFISRVERGLSHFNLKRLGEVCALLNVTEGEILNGTSSTSEQYLISEFNEIMKNATPEQQKLIFKIAKTIIEN